MSYPVRRCPFCGHELEDFDMPTVDTATEREKEIWRPWDKSYSYTESQESTTIDNGGDWGILKVT